jgi:hypothetical protein
MDSRSRVLGIPGLVRGEEGNDLGPLGFRIFAPSRTPEDI